MASSLSNFHGGLFGLFLDDTFCPEHLVFLSPHRDFAQSSLSLGLCSSLLFSSEISIPPFLLFLLSDDVKHLLCA